MLTQTIVRAGKEVQNMKVIVKAKKGVDSKTSPRSRQCCDGLRMC